MKQHTPFQLCLFLLAIILAGCQPTPVNEQPHAVFELRSIMPEQPSHAEALLQLDTYITEEDLRGEEEATGIITDGYLRSWDTGNESAIYLLVLQCRDSESASDIYQIFAEGILDDLEPLDLGTESLIAHSDLGLAVGGVWMESFVIISGTAVFSENGTPLAPQIVIDLLETSTNQLETFTQAFPQNTQTMVNTSQIESSLSPEGPMSGKYLANEVPAVEADTMTSQDIKIPLQLEDDANGHITIRLVTTNLGVSQENPTRECNYRVDAYIANIELTTEDGDDKLFRGNGDVMVYVDLQTVCDRVEYKTGDIAPKDGVESGKPIDFTGGNKTDGWKITTLECERDCLSQCQYSIYVNVRDADSNDALDIAGYLLSIGAKLTNNTKVVGDVKNLKEVLTGQPKEISSSDQSSLKTYFSNLRGDYLGQGNWPTSAQGPQNIKLPEPPEKDAESEEEPTSDGAESSPCLSGLVIGSEELAPILETLENDLSIEAGCDVSLEPSLNVSDMAERIESAEVDFAFVGFLDFYTDFYGKNAQPVLLTVNQNTGTFYGAAFLTRSDDGFIDLDELAGLRFAYSDPQDIILSKMTFAHIADAGYDPTDFFGETIAVGYDPVTMFSALLNGEVDVGAIMQYDTTDSRQFYLSQFPDIFDLTQITAATPLIPQGVILAADSEHADQIAPLMMSLNDNPALLDLYGIQSFIESGNEVEEAIIWLDYLDMLDWDLGGWPD